MRHPQVITISPEGIISGLQRKPGQGIDLTKLGKASVVRASEIVWEDTDQRWSVQVLRGAFAGRRLTVRDWLDHVPDAPKPEGLAMAEGWRPDDVMLFQDYDSAVSAEIAFLDALRLKGIL